MVRSFFLFVAVLVAAPSNSVPVYGVASVGDGDSMRISGVSFRLFGIDAPELEQTCSRSGQTWKCGAEAKAHLEKLVGRQEVRCIPVSKDQYDRVLARCITRETDLNKEMVESGYAVAFRKYALDYVDAEEAAKAARRGLWSSTFKMPELFRAEARSGRAVRRGTRRTSSYSAPARGSTPDASWKGRARGNCAIKGNHSRRGEWIYHLPGMPYYEQTRPEEIFCTEAEAQAAGYRRARVR